MSFRDITKYESDLKFLTDCVLWRDSPRQQCIADPHIELLLLSISFGELSYIGTTKFPHLK